MKISKFLYQLFLPGLVVTSWCIASCKKPANLPAENSNRLGMRTVSQPYQDIMNVRNLSPYSFKAVRAVQNALKVLNAPDAVMAGTQALNSANIQYYYSFQPANEAEWGRLTTWLSNDTSIQVIPVPLDSAGLYPQIFTDEKLEELNNDPKILYTTIPIGKPIPTGVTATLLDTLYVPDSSEIMLDFALNFMTGNLSYNYIQELKDHGEPIGDMIEMAYANKLIIVDNDKNGTGGGVGFIPMGGHPPDHMEHYNPIFDDINNREYEPIGPINRLLAPRDGRVTFVEPTRNLREGIRNLRLRFVRFTFFGPIHGGTWTDINGNYSISNFPRYGNGMLYLMFKNEKIKVKALSNNNVGNVLGSILMQPFEAMYARQIDFTEDHRTINVDFAYNSQQALWGMVMNGVAEANDISVTLGMRNSLGSCPFLCVIAVYANANNLPNSSPMLGQIGTSTVGLNWLYNLVGAGSSSPPASIADLPDMIISQHSSSPYAAHALRETIYHEYGHTLHYSKVGSQFWQQNIFASIPSDYGTSINAPRGNFFSLTEGWAEYIGQLFSVHKYGNTIVRDRTNATGTTTAIYDQQDSYINHLENNEHYYNSFIPKGIFYDITDDDVVSFEPSYDNVHGYSTNDIYQKLNPLMITIQDFRDKWENDNPNPANAALFNHYSIQ